MTWTTRPRSEHAGLAAISAGAGPRVLLLHGVGLRAEAWNAQIDTLASRFSVLAPDMAGHGESRPPQRAMALADYVDAVLPLLDAPAIVVGHSMGAVIALELAHRAPEKVRGVAALNAIFERTPDATRAVRARADSLPVATTADPDPTLQRWFGDAISPERTACEAWLRGVDPPSYKMAYAAFAASDGPARAALVSMPCPALFITGADEPNSTPAMSQAMAALAPRGQALVVDGAAHMTPMTQAEQVNAALLNFADATHTPQTERP